MKLVEWGGPNKEYRYTLWRVWDEDKGFVQFIGLNPSTADETQDDPTIRRCVGFAKDWGYGSICMTNLFAYRATLPKDMMAAAEPIGSKNDEWLSVTSIYASLIIAAWGTKGVHLGRDKHLLTLIPAMKCLRFTKGGFPEHPLYIPKKIRLLEYNNDTIRDHIKAQSTKDK